MRARDLRLVPVAGCAWAAAMAAVAAPDAAPWVAGALFGAALAVMAVGACVRGGRRTLWAVAAVALAVGGTAASSAAAAQPARTAAAHLAIGGGRPVSVQATVVGKPQRTARGEFAFDAVAHEIRVGSDRHRVVVPVTIRAADGPDIGTRVAADGTAVPARPGQRAVLAVRASQGLTVVGDPGGLVAVSAELRHALARATHGLPQPAAGLIPGLAVGDTGDVTPELDDAMKASSLSHLTAVSGANCAIVVGLAFGAAALCGARRGVRVAAGLVALGGFVLLVTPEPSVVRAAAMAAIAMLGVLLGRTGAGVSLLCCAVTVCLIADPWLASAMGFALSVAATGALLTLAAPLARGMSRYLPRALALALAVPLAAQLACGPLLILINPTVPLYGVVANLLAAPAAPLATVLGLAACLAAPLPVLASGLVALTWVPAAWISATATTAVALPASALPWPDGWAGAIALAVVGAAIAVMLAPRPPGRGGGAARAASAALVAILAGVGAGGVVFGSIVQPLAPGGHWAIAACDIGQGDAVLVRSAGAVALIDTGPDPRALQACLDRFGITRLDLLVLTHFDTDHAGGVDAVIGRADRILHGPPGRPTDERTLRRLIAGGGEVVAATAGMSGRLGGARWTVLWPRPADRVFTTGNEASVTVEIRGGGVPASVYLGDLDATAQRALLRAGTARPPYDVVKVSHHGSADQAPEFYRAMGARVALISVGAHNDYGHPRSETLAFLRAQGTVITRTDREGVPLVWQTDEGVVVQTDRAPGTVRAPG